ncbi:hypothetical protein LW347_11965 [Pectobacterium polonicum]|uniref:Nucleoside 2-deoxyribosyltransferase n=1 Tax=Pectobacterium polonicum TaxID=2485124 RepID=A0AAE9SYC6_9GAMM|nr:hypothetical protein [Pectobacterium polonicum]UVO06651.1 hypothetical protein LW347_11965 [Pectobacterium polonicum]
MNTNWVSLIGNIERDGNQFTLAPLPPSSYLPPTPNIQPNIPLALLKSSIEFENGIIELEVNLPTPSSICQIGLTSISGGTSSYINSTTEVFSGLNSLGAPYGFAIFKNNSWEPLIGSGQGSSITTQCWHQLRLHVQGSNLELFFDGVKVAITSQQIMRGQISLLLQSHERISVRNIKISAIEPICFVVMQFTDDYNELYEEVIRPTCEKFQYKVLRADDFYSSSVIIDDITRTIRECAIVIADVTPNNPNVFYEVGFAHGIGKPTILLSDRKREKLPFDISGVRTLFYDNTIKGKRNIEEGLRRHLDAITIKQT